MIGRPMSNKSRITSYNVCYTKLLRLVSWISLLSFSGVLVITILLLLLMRQHWGSLLQPRQTSPSVDDLPLRHFYEQSFIAMAISSPDTRRWLQFNNQLCKLLGYSRDELERVITSYSIHYTKLYDIPTSTSCRPWPNSCVDSSPARPCPRSAR